MPAQSNLEAPIAQAARSFIPVTWDALKTDIEVFGPDLLQGWINVTKEKLFGTVISDSIEENYPLRVIRYAGKMVAKELIAPGVDYWMSQNIALTTTGTSEVAQWTDRANRLEELGNRLGLELRQEAAEIYALLGQTAPQKRRPYIGISTDEDDVLLSPNPRTFPRLFSDK
jgi:hypothetical protein